MNSAILYRFCLRFGKAGELQILCCQGFAVDHYSCTLGALALKPSDFCNVRVKNAASLTKQLLGFARSGKYEIKPTDANDIVNKSSEMFGRTKKEITIHKKCQPDIWTVEVDQSQIEQVLLNLYVNAWQAMSGTGELYLQTENIILNDNDIKPYGVNSGRFVKISVTDTGVGIDETIQHRIFDPFFTTKEVSRDTGMGLASAYGIIKSHGGIINANSKNGQGATFNILT